MVESPPVHGVLELTKPPTGTRKDHSQVGEVVLVPTEWFVVQPVVVVGTYRPILDLRSRIVVLGKCRLKLEGPGGPPPT